jgi:hypothetical protein
MIIYVVAQMATKGITTDEIEKVQKKDTYTPYARSRFSFSFYACNSGRHLTHHSSDATHVDVVE